MKIAGSHALRLLIILVIITVISSNSQKKNRDLNKLINNQLLEVKGIISTDDTNAANMFHNIMDEMMAQFEFNGRDLPEQEEPIVQLSLPENQYQLQYTPQGEKIILEEEAADTFQGVTNLQKQQRKSLPMLIFRGDLQPQMKQQTQISIQVNVGQKNGVAVEEQDD